LIHIIRYQHLDPTWFLMIILCSCPFLIVIQLLLIIYHELLITTILSQYLSFATQLSTFYFGICIEFCTTATPNPSLRQLCGSLPENPLLCRLK